jgi:hypothetical protein
MSTNTAEMIEVRDNAGRPMGVVVRIGEGRRSWRAVGFAGESLPGNLEEAIGDVLREEFVADLGPRMEDDRSDEGWF